MATALNNWAEQQLRHLPTAPVRETATPAERRSRAQAEQLERAIRCGIAERPKPQLPPKPKGLSKQEWKAKRRAILAEHAKPTTVAEKWAGKKGTPETLEKASRAPEIGLELMRRGGAISDDQAAWADEIAAAAASIAADVSLKASSLRPRDVDQDPRWNQADERIGIIWMHMAYTRWREQLPAPKQVVLDMLTGERISINAAAGRHRVHKRKARRWLIEALDRWPDCQRAARDELRPADLAAMQAGLL